MERKLKGKRVMCESALQKKSMGRIKQLHFKYCYQVLSPKENGVRTLSKAEWISLYVVFCFHIF